MIFFEILKLLLSIAIVLFIPGYFLLRAVLHNRKDLISQIEKLVLSFALSITLTNLFLLIMNWLGIFIGKISILFSIFVFSFLCWFVAEKFSRKDSSGKKKAKDEDQPQISLPLNFSSHQKIIFLLVFAFSVLVRMNFIAQDLMPQTTDLGHHMYWAKVISTTGILPTYEDSIAEAEDVGKFIIGEHIIFGAIASLSGVDFISAMPVSILFLINIFSLLAIFILTYRLSELLFGDKEAKTISLFSLLVVGVFYGVSSPQAKFVSGGVIGNIIGNLLLPLILYTLIMTLKTKEAVLASLFLALCWTLAYTHHLTAFVFLFALLGAMAIFVGSNLLVSKLNPKPLLKEILSYAKVLLKIQNIVLFFAIVLFFFYIAPPSYLNETAIDTAVGSPVKSTRVGLPLNDIISTTGPWRFFYGGLGMLVLLALFFSLFKKKDSKENSSLATTLAALSIILSWAGMLFLMTYRPALLMVDIPSNRIGTYLVFPFAILSSVAIYKILLISRNKLPYFLFPLIALAVLGTGYLSGLSDVSEAAKIGDISADGKEVQQTYIASEYLKETTDKNEIILKDHVYLQADSWMKLFLMRGYKNPLSRGLLKRYEDVTKNRETCTRDMIAIPDEEIGLRCFEDTKTKYIVLKNGVENQQFEGSPNFSKIFAGDSVVIYMRN